MVVPTDWKEVRLGDHCDANWGNTTITKSSYVDSGVTAFSASGPDGFVSWHEHNGDGLVLSAIGALCGKTWLAQGKWTPIKNTIWIKAKSSNCSTRYVYHATSNPEVWPSRGAAQPFIALGDVRVLKLLLPPLKEQEAIAEALSDSDTAIESLGALIAKKRDVKRATMQRLLTGRTRLPGFTGDWETVRLEDFADCFDHLRVPLNESERLTRIGDYPYCGANGVLGFIDRYLIDDEMVLIAEDGGYFDEFATRPIAYKMSGKFWVNNHAHVLKAKPSKDNNYLYYSLVHKDVTPYLASGTRAKLNKSEMWKIEIRAPKSITEQEAIAEALSAMDDELEALTEQVSKLRMVKEGMMQDLLTGKVRLV